MMKWREIPTVAKTNSAEIWFGRNTQTLFLNIIVHFKNFRDKKSFHVTLTLLSEYTKVFYHKVKING